MEAAQTSALALYVGLNLLLTFLLAVNVVRHRFKGDSADPVMLEKRSELMATTLNTSPLF